VRNARTQFLGLSDDDAGDDGDDDGPAVA